MYQINQPIQVVFTHRSYLVVRAQSIHLFQEPEFLPITSSPFLYSPLARHSWGWTDGIAVTTRQAHSDPEPQPLSILVRREVDDPWATERPKLDLYTLEPNPDYADSPSVDDFELGSSSTLPYLFPPYMSASVHSIKGRLQCFDLRFGHHGTAAWINPSDPTAGGLAEVSAISPNARSETLVVALFPGPMKSLPQEGSVLATNPSNNWTCLDYD